jgi:hypothetical protein
VLSAESAGRRSSRKAPGMALQNLHPRFKSGRRLQNPSSVRFREGGGLENLPPRLGRSWVPTDVCRLKEHAWNVNPERLTERYREAAFHNRSITSADDVFVRVKPYTTIFQARFDPTLHSFYTVSARIYERRTLKEESDYDRLRSAGRRVALPAARERGITSGWRDCLTTVLERGPGPAEPPLPSPRACLSA